jgi:hypothetical protein
VRGPHCSSKSRPIDEQSHRRRQTREMQGVSWGKGFVGTTDRQQDVAHVRIHIAIVRGQRLLVSPWLGWWGVGNNNNNHYQLGAHVISTRVIYK